MTMETKRDLSADLALCNSIANAAPGKWFVMHGKDVCAEFPPGSGELDDIANSYTVGIPEFIAESREGWPESIRRAIVAEAEVERLSALIESESECAIDMIAENERLRESERWLKALVSALDDGRLQQTRLSSGTDYVVLSARMHVQNLDSPDMRSEAVTSDTEVERLREILSGIFAKAQNDVARWDGGMCVGTPVFQDRPYTRRLVDELRPELFPEVPADATR